MILVDIILAALIVAASLLIALEIFEWLIGKAERKMERDREKEHYEF